MLRPKLKDKYHVECVPGEGYFLLAEAETHVLEGQYIPYVVPLLDGTRTVDEIIAAAQQFVRPNDVVNTLSVLQNAGHLTEADHLVPPSTAAFWSEFDVDTRVVRGMLSTCTVEVRTAGQVDAGPLINLLAGFGVRTGPDSVAAIVITDDYLRPELAHINQECLRRKLPMLLIKPVGMYLWLGPLLIPPRTACWRCLEARLRGNREVENYVERKTGRPGPFPVARSRIQACELQAYSMAAVQLIKWLVTGANPALESRLLIAGIAGLSFQFHPIVKRPQCPDCGNPLLGLNTAGPIGFSLASTSADSQNGLRSESPEVTFLRYQHHISQYTGIVREVAPSFWNGVGPLRMYMAGHNFALKSDELYFLKDGLRTHSSGKGKTDAQARTSALCEALERYSGVFRGDETCISRSYDEMGSAAIDPRACMMFSETQYAERDKWLARGSRFQIVPIPFDARKRIDWTPVWSLTERRQKYLPSSYLFYNYPTPPNEFFCWADSNGCAAGVTLEEAMLQGLLELVERDAVALWWYNRVRRAGVDLDSFEDGFLSEVKHFYKSRDREMWVLDLTSDLNVPVFAAISRRVSAPVEDIMMGYGAHVDDRIALNRAVTELNQFIPALLNIGPDGQTIYTIGDNDALHWWKTAKVRQETYLCPGSVPLVTPSEYAIPPAQPVAAILQNLIATLEGRGHEVLMLDQTRPDIGLPVVKMIVPGLRHFWARFAPGRLYDVPVAMNWVPKPLREQDLNPTPMFL